MNEVQNCFIQKNNKIDNLARLIKGGEKMTQINNRNEKRTELQMQQRLKK